MHLNRMEVKKGTLEETTDENTWSFFVKGKRTSHNTTDPLYGGSKSLKYIIMPCFIDSSLQVKTTIISLASLKSEPYYVGSCERNANIWLFILSGNGLWEECEIWHEFQVQFSQVFTNVTHWWNPYCHTDWANSSLMVSGSNWHTIPPKRVKIAELIKLSSSKTPRMPDNTTLILNQSYMQK